MIPFLCKITTKDTFIAIESKKLIICSWGQELSIDCKQMLSDSGGWKCSVMIL